MTTTLTKKHLNSMLKLLKTDTLARLNSQIISTEPYKWGVWGYKPLLKYAPETLVKYGAKIYQYVLTPLTPEILSDNYLEQYLSMWLSFYEPAETMFKTASVGYATRLLDISRTPITIELPPNMIEEHGSVYDEITSYFNKELDMFYPDFSSFLYTSPSPLRRPTVTDQRIIEIVREVDELLVPHNEALDSFVRTELRRLRRLVNDRLRYINLKSEDIITLEASKHRIPIDDWDTIEKALTAGSLATSDLNLTNKTINDIKNAQQAQREKEIKAKLKAKEEEEEKHKISAEGYLSQFIDRLNSALQDYKKKLVDMRENSNIDPLNDIFAFIYATQLSKVHGTTIEDIQQIQAEGEAFYLNLENYSEILSACLRIDILSLSLVDVIPSEVQEHGVIKALLKFSQDIRYYLRRRVLNLNYTELVNTLYELLHTNTDGFGTALPVPDIVPFSDDNIASIPRAPRLDNRVLTFDLAITISKVLTNISTDTIITNTEILSEKPDLSLLTPINDTTIKNMAYYLTGTVSEAYMYNGDFIIHNLDTDQYIKVIPTIRDDGYADYIFRGYSYSTLSSRIYRLQELLKTSAEYCYKYLEGDDGGHRKYQQLPKNDLRKRKKAIDNAKEWGDLLISRANDIFGHGVDNKKAREEVTQIAQTRYYHSTPIYLSAHRLAAYAYYPVEYTSFISAKATDPETGELLRFEPNHKDGCRHNNSKENLEIISRPANQDLRSTSKPVKYKDARYPTIKAYCDATEAGVYVKLQQTLSKAEQGETVTYKDRVYTLDPDIGLIIATDTQAPQYIFDGMRYEYLKDFTEAQGLVYDTIQKGIARARKAGKTEYKHKEYKFYLDSLGNIKITK